MTTITITRLEDDLITRLGEPVTSRYVEAFWRPILGPTAVWLLREASYQTAAGPFTVDAEVLGRLLGVGGVGPHSPLMKTLGRLVAFDAACRVDDTTWALRADLGPLPVRHLRKLPQVLVDAHSAWVHLGPMFEPLGNGLYRGPACIACGSRVSWVIDADPEGADVHCDFCDDLAEARNVAHEHEGAVA